MGNFATGFAKEAGILGSIAKKVITPKTVGAAALVGAGAAGGVYATKKLQGQRPLPRGALIREKRRAEIDRYGSL